MNRNFRSWTMEGIDCGSGGLGVGVSKGEKGGTAVTDNNIF